MPACSRINSATLSIATSVIALAIVSPALAQQTAQPAELPPVVVEGSQAKAPKKVAKKSVAPKAKDAPAPAAPAPQPDETAGAGGSEETAKGAVDGVVAKRSASGTKTDTPIISTPQSISVVGREQMERQGAQTITQAMRYAPGVRADTFGNDARNDWFLLRGFQAQTNGYFLDGLQLYSTSFATWKIEPWGLDRLEIIRGPSSALYGGGNPAGLINGVSKRPGPDATRSLSTGIDEYGNGFGALDVGGRLGSGEQVYYRLNMLGRLGDTEVDDIDNDRFYIAPSLLWRPNADTSITLFGSYQKDRTAIQNFLPYNGTVKPSPVFGRIPTSLNINNPGYGEFSREQTTAGYEIEHRVNDAVRLRQNLRYGELNIDLGGLVGFDFNNGASPNLFRYNFLTAPRAKQFNVDNQAEVRFGTGALSHKVLVGLDYTHYRLGDDQGSGAAPALNMLTLDYLPVTSPTSRYLLNTTTLDQIGLYLQDEIKVDRLTFLLTGRQDWLSIDRDDKLVPGAGSTYSDHDAATTYRAAAIYNFDNGVAPYVAYSTSFDPQLGVGASGQAFQPEEGEGFEAGIKYEPRWMNARFTAAYFDITKSNVLTAVSPTLQRQIGEVSSEGFEFEAVATPMPGLNLTGSYTIYDLETTKDGNPNLIGNTPKFVPEQFGGLFADYTLQSGWAKGFGFGAGVRYVGRSFADDANLFKVPSYTLADATIHYERDGWLTALSVSNLFDDTYVSGCNGVESCFYGERRKAMLTATYKW